LVEDSADAREPLARLLEREWPVVAAQGGEEALRLCREQGPFAVVVTDHEMPGMKGTELLERISSSWPETVGVMLTGKANLEVAVRALHQGRVFRFLRKPYEVDSLLSALREAVERHAQIVEDRRFAEELVHSKESLASFTAALEERIQRQTAALTRLHEFAVALNGAGSLEEILNLAADATFEILGGRGVIVQIWDEATNAFGVAAARGPEMSERQHCEPLTTPEGRIGEIAVDARGPAGDPLSESERRLLGSLASSTAVAAHNELHRRERDEAQHATIFALARLAERRDNETGKHLERVAAYCELAAEALREDGKHPGTITDAWIEDLVRSSPLHDIGKVGIPDSILLKPGKLTAEEWEIMRTHPEIGAITLESVISEHGHQGFLAMGRDIALCHHEKWDGSGYPRGLRGTEIPLSARLLALADVYDALTTVRPYKTAWTHEDAITWIRQHSGSHFDPDVVKAFMRRAEEARAIQERLADSEEELQPAFRAALV
jgi:response regulator RpfG family c-di-GMP phosphodiesterase